MGKSEQKNVLPKRKYGETIGYGIKQEQKVRNVLLNGCLESDDNLAEGTVKPFVIGRKNWLSANTLTGANTSCTAYSVVQTAIANGLKPFEYVKYILTKLRQLERLCDY